MGMNRILVTILLFGFFFLSAQDEDRYMVFYKDKSGTTFSTDQPYQFLSYDAVIRRIVQNKDITEQDFPVNVGYKSQVYGTGARVVYSSRWFNASMVEATPSEISAIQGLAIVDRVEFVAPGKTGTGGRKNSSSKFAVDSPAPVTVPQTSMLGIDELHREGFQGEGITIAVLDTGFPGITANPAFSDLMLDQRIGDFFNFAAGYPHVFLGHDHGARVFSIMAGKLDNYVGAATKANYLLYATEYTATEYRAEEYYWAFAAERADSAGADIISSSLGYTEFDDASMNYSYSDLDGETAVITQAAQMAFDRGIIVVNAAGNLGGSNDPWHYISPPADGKDILAVGAVDFSLNRSGFSSFGPSADGRVKPDIVALGTQAANINPFGLIQYGNGTSYSCPLIAGFIACLWEAHPELNAVEMIDMVRKAGSQYFNPDFSLGYGIPTYQAIQNMYEFPYHTGIRVYPNPIEYDKLKIAIGPTDGSEISFQVFSIMGQPIHEEVYLSNWHSNPYDLDFSGQPAGVYLVKVRHGYSTKTFQVVKL
jgi:serine protease AprX